MEGRGGEHQDRAVDEQREQQRRGAVEGRETDGFALAVVGAGKLAGLNDRAVQIEVVRHHRRTDDPDRDVEHRRVRNDLRARHQAVQQPRHVRPRQRQFDRQAGGDDDQQSNDEGFELAKAMLLQEQDQQDVGGGQAHAGDEWDPEQQLERDCRCRSLRQGRRRRSPTRTAATAARAQPEDIAPCRLARDPCRWLFRGARQAPGAASPQNSTAG
jgi:hypothetical protein